MSTAVQTKAQPDVYITPEETALLSGDLSKLTPDGRAALYMSVCRSLGLNPLTQPFAYITLNSKLTMYALKNCTDQLRAIHNVNLQVIGQPEVDDGVLYVRVRATLPNGRMDEDLGAVSIKGLAGEPLANARMKAITKAKRRVTLSICGLGMLDDSEVDSISGAWRVEETPARQLSAVNKETGEITTPDEPKDTDPVPDKWLRRLRKLAAELTALDGTVTEVPSNMTVLQAKELSAAINDAIAVARVASQSDADVPDDLPDQAFNGPGHLQTI